MKRIPVFFEAWESQNHAELQICRKVMRALLKKQVAPLPFASSITELQDVLGSLAQRNMAPGIFVINTFWAEELLGEIDPLMPEHTPALYFRRGLSADVRDRDMLNQNPHYGNTMMELGKLAPRLTSVWIFGKLTVEPMAERAAQSIVRYLDDCNFTPIERAGAVAQELSRTGS